MLEAAAGMTMFCSVCSTRFWSTDGYSICSSSCETVAEESYCEICDGLLDGSEEEGICERCQEEDDEEEEE